MSGPPGFSYVRLYADEHGLSRFEDVALDAGEGGAFAPLAVESLVPCAVTAPPAPGPHNAPRRQLIVHLEGAVEVRASGGETRRFGPGDVVLAEDVEGAGHVTSWVGEGPWRWLLLSLRG